MAGQPQDFYASGPPLSPGILVGGYSYLLAGFQALRTTFVPLAGGNLLAEDDDCMSHFYAAQQVIASLNENPSRRGGFAHRRINYLALEDSFGCNRRRGSKQGQQEQA